MKRLTISFFLLGAAALSAAPAGPAFAGLHAIESLPSASASQVVEIRGERGEPQPAEWLVVLHDSSARGGTRELTMANGRITSERTPVHGSTEIAALVPISSAKLKFDSDSVFRTAQSEAERNQVGFDSISYKLRADPESKAPVWSVSIFDKQGGTVATMRISASDGTVVRPFKLDANARPQKEASEEAIPIGGVVGAVGNAAVDVAKKTKNSALHLVGTLQEVFVGERTIGTKDDE